jgi:hypothetical protein
MVGPDGRWVRNCHDLYRCASEYFQFKTRAKQGRPRTADRTSDSGCEESVFDFMRPDPPFSNTSLD